MRLTSLVGKTLYYLLWPLIHLALWRSKRVYVVVVVGNKILLTKNWLGPHNKWRLPGGGLKRGESYIAAAIRELQEEVGINASAPNLSKINTNGHITNKHNYYALKLDSLPELKVQKSEIMEACFQDISSLSNETLDKPIDTVLSSTDWR